MRRREGTFCALVAATLAVTLLPRAAAAGLIVPEYRSFAQHPPHAVNLILDFDGDTTATYGPYTPGTTPAYDIDGDAGNFSAQELDNIRLIWQSVAEKYSPFNVDVSTYSTVQEGGPVGGRMRVVIGGDGAWLPGDPAGGVSGLAAYMNSLPNIAFVFPANLANGFPKYVAEAAAHEAGHAFDLKHQSLYDGNGNKLKEYNPGDATKAPIMGISYASQRAVWWRGSNTDGQSLIQDDLLRLSLFGTQRPNFGYREDDHASTLADAASPLAVDPDFSLDGAGIIERMSDVDYFSFTTPGGRAHIVADVAPFGAMLDLSMSLYDAADNLLATAATSSLGESLTYALEPGIYRLGITSAGNYGDVGQYYISGTVVPEPASAAGAVLLLFSQAFCRRRVR